MDMSRAKRFVVSVTCLSGAEVDVIFTSPDTTFSTQSYFSPRVNEELVVGGGGGDAAPTPSSPNGTAPATSATLLSVVAVDIDIASHLLPSYNR